MECNCVALTALLGIMTIMFMCLLPLCVMAVAYATERPTPACGFEDPGDGCDGCF